MKLKKSILAKIAKFFKLFIKYVVPVVVGWLEGDTHAMADALINLLSLF